MAQCQLQSYLGGEEKLKQLSKLSMVKLGSRVENKIHLPPAYLGNTDPVTPSQRL